MSGRAAGSERASFVDLGTSWRARERRGPCSDASDGWTATRVMSPSPPSNRPLLLSIQAISWSGARSRLLRMAAPRSGGRVGLRGIASISAEQQRLTTCQATSFFQMNMSM
eukprot:5301398-Prymnesium_polylepis.1